MKMFDPIWGFGYCFKNLHTHSHPPVTNSDAGRDVRFCYRWLLYILKGLYTYNMLRKLLNAVKAWQTL